MGTEEIYNYRKVSDRVATAGLPTEEQLRAAAAEGFVAVVNLLPFDPLRSLPDEEGLVRSLGMAYHHIPVAWDDPKESDFGAFEAVMEELGPAKTLVHCAANFRVTAFYSLYARKRLGWSEARGEELRASIWKGTDNPVWDRFIERIEARIAGQEDGPTPA